MNNWKVYLIGLVLLVIAFSAGRFSAPAKIETKQVEQSESHTTRDQNVVEVTRETKAPDGTIIKETRKETQTTATRETEIKKVSSTSIDIRPSYRVGVLYEPAIRGFQGVSGSLLVERRLFSEVFIGASYSSNKTIGLILSLGF